MRSFASRMSSASVPSPSAAGEALLERGRREPRGDLARLRAAHAVRDREERRLADEGVLVVRPPPPGVGERARATGSHASTCRSVWPMRTTSPGDEQPGSRDASAVDEGAVRRADVLDPEAVGPRLEHGVAGRGEVVAVEADRVLAAAAEPRRLPDLERRCRAESVGLSSTRSRRAGVGTTGS